MRICMTVYMLYCTAVGTAVGTAVDTATSTAETTPLLLTRFSGIRRKEHPAVKMLRGLSPIDCDSFKQERPWWKVIIIIKVLCYSLCMELPLCVCVCVRACVRACVYHIR